MSGGLLEKIGFRMDMEGTLEFSIALHGSGARIQQIDFEALLQRPPCLVGAPQKGLGLKGHLDFDAVDPSAASCFRFLGV